MRLSKLTAPLVLAFAVAILATGPSASAQNATSENTTTRAGSSTTTTGDIAATVMTAQLGKPAPDFTLPKAGGGKGALSDYRGQWVVLEWINYGCPFVTAHYGAGNMQAQQTEFTKQDVAWLTICSSAEGKQGYYEGKELVKQIEAHNARATAYMIDKDGLVGRMYDAKTTPQMYIVNPEGLLVFNGPIDDHATTRQAEILKATSYVRTILTAGLRGDKVEPRALKSYGCAIKYG